MARHDVVLERAERDRLVELATEHGHVALADRIGVGATTLKSAMAGAPVVRATASALRAGIDALSDGPRAHRVG